MIVVYIISKTGVTINQHPNEMYRIWWSAIYLLIMPIPNPLVASKVCFNLKNEHLENLAVSIQKQIKVFASKRKCNKVSNTRKYISNNCIHSI